MSVNEAFLEHASDEFHQLTGLIAVPLSDAERDLLEAMEKQLRSESRTVYADLLGKLVRRHDRVAGG